MHLRSKILQFCQSPVAGRVWIDPCRGHVLEWCITRLTQPRKISSRNHESPNTDAITPAHIHIPSTGDRPWTIPSNRGHVLGWGRLQSIKTSLFSAHVHSIPNPKYFSHIQIPITAIRFFLSKQEVFRATEATYSNEVQFNSRKPRWSSAHVHINPNTEIYCAHSYSNHSHSPLNSNMNF